VSRPDWRAVYQDALDGVVGQLRAERVAGNEPRVGMRNFSDGAIDDYALREAEKRVQAAINRWNVGK
jgi:hypothetical protein